jgi:uncharacterized damage-inducible protein DinB
MATTTLASHLLEQYDRAFQMLRELVCAVDEADWKQGQVPARWAYHAVQGTEFYLGDKPDELDWSKVVDWEGPAESLPDQEALIAYAEMVQRRLRERWAWRSDSEMADATDYPWTGDTKLAQLLYNLRHFTYHTGELSMILRESGADSTPWH